MNNKYCVVIFANLRELADEVCHLMNQGWIPQGGIAVDAGGFKYQAMIKIDVENKIKETK